MASPRSRHALWALPLAATACNAIIGLDGLKEVDCVTACTTGTGGAGGGSGDAGLAKPSGIWPGRGHGCANLVDGTLLCWGSNDSGQLGDGTTMPHARPAVVPGIKGVTYVSLGLAYTCAVATGGVYCWGSNSRGQLGDGTTIDRPQPTLVKSLIGTANKVQAGEDHTCAEMADGTPQCWGSNIDGELGDGTTMDSHTPLKVKGLPSTVKKISIGGGHHTCAALDDGSVWCWGLNDAHQLGVQTPASSSMPVQVMPLMGVKKVWVGRQHSCALLGDGTVQCWGANDFGQLGDGTTNGRAAPAPVMGLSDVVSMGGGYRHTCASLNTTPTAKCWGANDHGQIGIGDAGAFVLEPALVPGLVVANETAAARGESSCSISTDGNVYCWGWNDDGQLGDGTMTDRPSPTRVSF